LICSHIADAIVEGRQRYEESLAEAQAVAVAEEVTEKGAEAETKSEVSEPEEALEPTESLLTSEYSTPFGGDIDDFRRER